MEMPDAAEIFFHARRYGHSQETNQKRCAAQLLGLLELIPVQCAWK